MLLFFWVASLSPPLQAALARHELATAFELSLGIDERMRLLAMGPRPVATARVERHRRVDVPDVDDSVHVAFGARKREAVVRAAAVDATFVEFTRESGPFDLLPLRIKRSLRSEGGPQAWAKAACAQRFPW